MRMGEGLGPLAAVMHFLGVTSTERNANGVK
jgi:hypothetical protein